VATAVTGNTVLLEGPGCEGCQLCLPGGFACNSSIRLELRNVFWHLQIGREERNGENWKYFNVLIWL